MSPASGSPASRPLANRTVLVVDDADSIRGVLQTALTDAGAETWLAEDGVAALRLLADAIPDIILLDLVMPRLDGWGVLDELRRSPRTARIPVILETSAEDYRSFDRARRDGVAAFISKPFRLNEVIETCRRVFEGARPLQGAGNPPSHARSVQVRSPDGKALASAVLIDSDTEGAQIELSVPLPLGATVLLGPIEPGQQVVSAEVRWVTYAGERCCAGVQFRAVP
jgi:two-component system chemotaxis response regulator CheY